jgi:hypothetical protein
MLTSKRLVAKSQAYFWTRQWPATEADIQAGRGTRFGSVMDMLGDLDA